MALVAVGEPARPLRYIGVLPGDEGAGPRAVARAAGTAARLRVYEPGGGWEAYRSSAERAGVREVERAGSAADDVAAGEVDALVVPDWPHGLAGRLRRRGRPARDPAGRCVLVIVPLRVETVTPATVAAAR